jgi:hypothetical protein
MTGCDPVGETYAALGVRANDAGHIIIHYALCQGERVQKVELWDFEPPLYGDDDETLWRIRARPGRAQATFVVGTTPAGFAQRISLEGPLVSGRTYSATVTTNLQAIAGNVFQLDDLKDNRWLVLDGSTKRYLDEEAFLAGGRQRC